MNEDLECINCPVCNSSDYRKVYNSKDYLYSKKFFSIVGCNSCGLMYTNPRIKEKQIGHYYFSEYAPYNIKQSKGIVREIKNKISSMLADNTLPILEELKHMKTKTVLEIGPGSGIFLSMLKERGFTVAGVDIDKDCVQQLRSEGITCYQGSLTEVIDEIIPNKSDAIILCQVFEHIYNPVETLKLLYKLLNQNGIIYVTVPNSNSWEARLFKKYWRGFDLPRHVIHYDDITIKEILTKNGFVVKRLASIVFPSSFLESIGFRFFKNSHIPQLLYLILYYPWKLLQTILVKAIGSGVIEIIAYKNKVD